MPLDGPKKFFGSVHESVPQLAAVILPQLLLVRVVALDIENADFLFLDDFDPCKFWFLVGKFGKAEDEAKGVAFLYCTVWVDWF